MPTRKELHPRLGALQDRLPQLLADEAADLDYLDFQAHAEAVLSAPSRTTQPMCARASMACWLVPD